MKKLEEYIALIEERLLSYFPDENSKQGRAISAAKHSLDAGGKRIRPILVLAFCEMCGGDINNAIDVACAVEYMHTFSLIHDDLPCMDNDDFRRGKPSCHKAFDEPTALLAGDALAVLPFEMISDASLRGKISCSAGIKSVKTLSDCVGLTGMIGGQQIDTDTENSSAINNDTLLDMYRMKTSCLLKAACCCGVICAESDNEEEYLRLAGEYADNLGLAFQLVDDILDVTSTTEVLGKPVGSDAEQDKRTYVALNGVEKARSLAEKCTEKSLEALSAFPNNGFVAELTEMLLKREK